MAEYNNYTKRVRSYEVSIWTLQDRFLSVLKWATMDLKGLIQEPEIVLRDDGTQEFSFTIPLFYYDGDIRISNPLWSYLDKLPLEANMHKLKVVFNKNTEDEAVLEFLVVSVTADHALDEVDITVKAEGLAFHELGKTGYKISLSQENYEAVEDEWFDNGFDYETGLIKPRPLMNLQFWNDLIFKDSDGDWRTNWTYEIRMDWSAFSNSEVVRKSDILYEDAYISSWELASGDIKPRAVENLREKERPIEISESNYYNVTLTIAELFGVFCKYEYEHNDRYEITGRKVVYYNNYIKDSEGHIDLTYPYSSQSITRTSDNTELTTKLFVLKVEDEDYGDLSIMDVDANKLGEEYLLNFDYLVKIGAINEELIDDLKKFEIDVRFLNDLIKTNRERKRIVENQLIQASADVTYYTNAIKLDAEEKAKAEKLKDAITDGTGYTHLEKAFTVMDGREAGYGYYINITLEGLDGGSIALYERRLSMTGQNGVGYLNPITGYLIIEDEYGNIIRLLNLSRDINAIDDSLVWLIGQYSPGSYYLKIIDTWTSRLAIDTLKLDEVTELEADLNWYLHGSRVGYAIASGTRLDGEYSGIGLVWDESFGPIPNENSRDFNLYVDYTLDVRILANEHDVNELKSLVPNEDISKITFDYFDEDDIYNSTPDLIYYFEIYSKLKEKLVNAFERMMGPALREGYWKPEDYNDYGDVYYDSFVINQTDPTTPYLHFIWDSKKYYELESSIIYTANTAGDMRLYLAIDLTNYLPKIKDHLGDLFFGYRDPITYKTVRELGDTINQLSIQLLDIYPKDTTILDATYVSIYQWKYYWLNLNNLTNPNLPQIILLNSHDNDAVINKAIKDVDDKEGVTQLEKDKIRTEFYRHELEQLKYTTAVLVGSLILRMFNNDSILPVLEDRNNGTVTPLYTIENLTSLIETIEDLNSYLDQFIDYYESFITVEKNILKRISDPKDYGAHSISDTTATGYPGHLQLLTQEKEKASNLRKLGTKVLSWYNLALSYLNQIATIEANKEGYYHTYGIGSGCEFGWIYDTYQNSTYTSDTSKWRLIPALIVTGANTLSDDVLKYLQTGEYTYKSGITNEINETVYKTISAGITERAFLGYYTTDVYGADNDQYIEKLVTSLDVNTDYIGSAFEEKLIIEENKISRPIKSEEYRYLRVYPRLYFSSLKLRDAESKLRLKLNYSEISSNQDYYLVLDDRSKGLKTSGLGYYLTIRPEVIYKYLCLNLPVHVDVLYTLLNADTSIYLDAVKVSKENALPKVSYDVELSILNPTFIRTAYNRLNLIVYINDNDLKLEEVSGYISSVTLKLNKPWEDTVEIKNYLTKFEDLFSTIVAQTEAMKKSEGGLSNAVKAFTANGFINSDILLDSVLKADLNLAFNRGRLVISQNDGIWAFDDDNKGVVAFRGGGIFTATSKDTNGNWIWNTGILPSGINADLITSGQIDTNRIKIYSGNDVRFQLNSEGLFAYKDFTIDSDTLKNLIGEEPKSGIDSNQYVVYNSLGLFLTAKEGTWYKTADTDNSYKQTVVDVNRVEVSWDGFILRNWEDEEVFYADPDTGNLVLKGRILANSGEIAGWDILSDRLSNGPINLISNGANSGIYLSSSEAIPEILNIDNTIYYKYSYKLNNDTVYCYSTYNDIFFTIDNDHDDDIFNITYGNIGVKPKQIIAIRDSEGMPHLYISNLLEEEQEGPLMTIETVPVPIEWDGKTTENSDWYQVLISNYPEAYETYIEYVKGYTITLLKLNNGITLTQTGFSSIFSVNATDGNISIRKGTLGNLLINDTGNLSGTPSNDGGYIGSMDNIQLDLNNYVIVMGKKIELGEFIYSCAYDAGTNSMSFKQLNGNIITVPIATSTTSNNSGSDSGSSTCNNCSTSCSTTCTNGCKGNCQGGCSGDCTSSCARGCASGCAAECTGACRTCTSCTATCRSVCKGSSGGGCFTSNTLITLCNDTAMPIAKLNKGMRLKSYDELSLTFVDSKIIGILRLEHKNDIIDIILSNGDKITATKSHPLLTTEGWKAVDVEMARYEHNTDITLLLVGNLLINDCAEPIYIKDIINRVDLNDTVVYNIDVDKYDTYIANNIVVHNAVVK